MNTKISRYSVQVYKRKGERDWFYILTDSDRVIARGRGDSKKHLFQLCGMFMEENDSHKDWLIGTNKLRQERRA